ncbi:MAG: NAD(P)H-dependent glycerol-3-phosphate dehydrogenase [Candidatus Omnitrophica bacterium]|nr:NAD(P)H-dependent glycerol-3-phosphate dehydrogenase [Candidatus Omnitrophota bacterium]
MEKISVIGDGGWGTALALLLVSRGVDTTLWSVSPEYAQVLRDKRENPKFLKGVELPPELRITSDEARAAESDHAVIAVPCEYLREVLARFGRYSFGYVVSATKGIEVGSLKRPSEILSEYFTGSDISVVSGPSISYEVARGYPTTVVLASGEPSREKARDLLMTEMFRVYTSDDVPGVELGGALKNVIAIAAGISDGLGFGANSKAALLTRGLAEISRLGRALGAKASTFSGLSGMGDLATTCISTHSRNRWFGEEIGKGKDPSELLSSTEMTVEGYRTARSANELSLRHGVDMPIIRKVYEVLYEGKDPSVAVRELMTRDPRDEDHT